MRHTLAFFHAHFHADAGGAFLALAFLIFVVALIAFACNAGNRRGGT